MNCPKCEAPMEPVTTEAGTVERCIACQGLWFDRLEASAQADFAAALDVGSEEADAPSTRSTGSPARSASTRR